MEIGSKVGVPDGALIKYDPHKGKLFNEYSKVNVEDLFNATDMVIGVLDSMVLKQKSKIN